MTWQGIHPAMSPQVPPCKSKGQYRFSLLVFTGCSSGSNNGLGWASSLLWCLLILSRMTSRKGCWSLCVEYDLLHTRVHLLWLWEFWIGISAWWLWGLAGAIPQLYSVVPYRFDYRLGILLATALRQLWVSCALLANRHRGFFSPWRKIASEWRPSDTRLESRLRMHRSVIPRLLDAALH